MRASAGFISFLITGFLFVSSIVGICILHVLARRIQKRIDDLEETLTKKKRQNVTKKPKLSSSSKSNRSATESSKESKLPSCPVASKVDNVNCKVDNVNCKVDNVNCKVDNVPSKVDNVPSVKSGTARSSPSDQNILPNMKNELTKQFVQSPPSQGSPKGEKVQFQAKELIDEIFRGPRDLSMVIRGTKNPVKRAKPLMNVGEFEDAVKELLLFLVDYILNPEGYPVSVDVNPGFLYNNLPTHAPDEPEPFKKIMEDFKKLIVPGMTHWQHPGYLGPTTSGRSIPDMLSEMLTSALMSLAFCWDASPAVSELDVAMLNWVAQSIGLPQGFIFQGNSETSPGGGCFVESPADGILCALVASRSWKTNEVLKSKGDIQEKEHFHAHQKLRRRLDIHHDIYSQLVAYSSKQANSSISKCASLAMIRLHLIQALAQNDFGITGELLEKQIIRDISFGLVPAVVVVTLGTTSMMASDNLKSICDVARKYHMWVHVDASTVGGFWVEPRFRLGPDALKYVDSITIMLRMHSDSMCFQWVQRQSSYKPVFRVYASYLMKRNKYPMDARDWGIHLGRRFKSIKLWTSYRMLGTEKMRLHLNKLVSLTARLERFLLIHDNLRILGKRNLNVLCLQYYDPELSLSERARHTLALCTYIIRKRSLLIATGKSSGEVFMRIEVSWDYANIDTVNWIAYHVLKCLEDYRAEYILKLPIENLRALSDLNLLEPVHTDSVIELVGTESTQAKTSTVDVTM